MTHPNQIKLVHCISLFLLASLVSACAQATTTVAEPIGLIDGYEREVNIPEPAQRVISIAPSSTEILFAIGAGSQVVGRDEVSDYPPEAIEVASIGSIYGDLNFEAIVALEPDLVLAARINSIEHIQALEDLGLVVFVLPNPMGMDDLYEVLAMAGKLTGRETEAEDLVDQLEIRVDSVIETLVGIEPVSVFYEIDGTDPNAPWTTGPGTFQDVLIGLAGGENIASDIESWGQLSLEEIVARDPAVIVFSESPYVATTPESLAERPGWGEIAAVINGRVYGIDGNWIDRPGPRYVDALEMLAKVLHPELFE